MAPKQGRLIISEPFLQGNYFNRSTVLLVEHNDEGAVGFILNKPVDFPINEFLDEFPAFDGSVYIGGPVSTNVVYFIHTLKDLLPGSIHVKDNLYWGGDIEQLKGLINAGIVDQTQIRFFLGYSGWSKGQLEQEIEDQSWLVADANVNVIMNSGTDFWKQRVNEAGGHYKNWQHFPEDPDWN